MLSMSRCIKLPFILAVQPLLQPVCPWLLHFGGEASRNGSATPTRTHACRGRSSSGSAGRGVTRARQSRSKATRALSLQACLLRDTPACRAPSSSSHPHISCWRNTSMLPPDETAGAEACIHASGSPEPLPLSACRPGSRDIQAIDNTRHASTSCLDARPATCSKSILWSRMASLLPPWIPFP